MSSALRVAWSEEPFEAGMASVAAVTVFNERLTAVGRDGGGLAAWVSNDGMSWERHSVPDPNPQFLDIEDAWSMGPLANLGETLFSFGNHGEHESQDPLGWRSRDGASWEHIQSDNAFFESGALLDLKAGDMALIAVVERGLIAPAQSVWRWTSAASWTETELTSTSDRTLAINKIIWSDGTFVAVGATYQATDAPQDEWPAQPAVWVSADGRHWATMAPPEGMRQACTLASNPDGGFLVLGVMRDGAAAWVSRDGATWTATGLLNADWDEGCWHTITPFAGGFVAGANASDSLIMSSSQDGLTWAHVELPGVRTSSHQLAALGNQVVVFANRLQADGSWSGSLLLRGIVSQ